MDLQSERVRNVCGNRGFCNLISVVRFYTPVSHGNHQDTIPLNLIKEAASEEWRGEQENGSELVKASSAIEEYFVDTGSSHALQIRLGLSCFEPWRNMVDYFYCELVTKRGVSVSCVELCMTMFCVR
jgi:hypothetical protein